jgi:hypothetical protein
MAHQNGRCATDARTVYVQQTTGCTDTDPFGQGGTLAAPFCSMTPVQNVIANNDVRTLVVVRGTVNASTTPLGRSASRAELSIIGQQTAVIAAGANPGLDLQSGQFYVRGVTISPSGSVGINAAIPNSSLALTLRLDTVTVDSCQKGGILLDGAAFDIKNTTVTNNGPGQNGTFIWGGILVKTLPMSGPTQLELVSIDGNNQVGLSCIGPVSGTGVFATGNTGGVNIGTACDVTPCSPASPGTCGASP